LIYLAREGLLILWLFVVVVVVIVVVVVVMMVMVVSVSSLSYTELSFKAFVDQALNMHKLFVEQ
jgi:beta-lactamase regulating signal transducer with metallopeptidase domain